MLEQRAAYRDVMAKLYNLGLRPALLYPAKLQITKKDGNKKRFSSIEEATAFAGSVPAPWGYLTDPSHRLMYGLIH